MNSREGGALFGAEPYSNTGGLIFSSAKFELSRQKAASTGTRFEPLTIIGELKDSM